MATVMMNPAVPGMTGAMPSGTATPVTGSPPAMNFLMVPRCTIRMQKCTGGMKILCTTDDKMACSMMQNLCTMLAGGMCSCCCMMNGMMVCCCNLMMGMCVCESTKEGVSITCTSGDKNCCAMIQACCESMSAMMEAGCTCCVLMNNTPVCCG
jgi:hypothetical protein